MKLKKITKAEFMAFINKTLIDKLEFYFITKKEGNA